MGSAFLKSIARCILAKSNDVTLSLMYNIKHERPTNCPA